MSWLVKLGKANKSPHYSNHRGFRSPNHCLPDLLKVPHQNQSRPFGLNRNNCKQRKGYQQQPAHQLNQFSKVIKDERERTKRRNSKGRKNIIFTENNCFTRAVADYKQQQKMKNTVKQVPQVIHEVEIDDSIDIQKTMKNKNKVTTMNKILGDCQEEISNKSEPQELRQTKVVNFQLHQNKENAQALQNQQDYQLVTNVLQTPSQTQNTERDLSPSKQRKTTVLKCRVTHTPTKVIYAHQNVIPLPTQQNLLLDQTNTIQYFPEKIVTEKIHEKRQIVQYTETVVTTTIYPFVEYKPFLIN